MENIEDYRSESIGHISVVLDGGMLLLSHAGFVNNSYNELVRLLYNLENIENFSYVKSNLRYVNAVTNNFISMECYVNDILKLFCSKSENDFEIEKKKNLYQRIKFIFQLAEIDILRFQRCGIIKELQEFEEFRNTIFHGGYSEKEIQINKTFFSSKPIYSNIIDVMQSFIIMIKIFTIFRYIVKGLDLMPNVAICLNSTLYHEKIDIVYKNFLEKYFWKILEKHFWSTKLNTSIDIFSLEPSEMFYESECKPCIRALPTQKEGHFNSTKTRILEELYTEFNRNIHIDENIFRLPDYIIHK